MAHGPLGPKWTLFPLAQLTRIPTAGTRQNFYMRTIFGSPWKPKQAHGAHFQALGLPSLFKQPRPRVLGLPGLIKQFFPRVWGLTSIFKQPLFRGLPSIIQPVGGTCGQIIKCLQNGRSRTRFRERKILSRSMVWPTVFSKGVVERKRYGAFQPSCNNPIRRLRAFQASSSNPFRG